MRLGSLGGFDGGEGKEGEGDVVDRVLLEQRVCRARVGNENVVGEGLCVCVSPEVRPLR